MSDFNSLVEFIKVNAVAYAIRIAAAVVIFVIGKYIAKAISSVAFKGMVKTRMDETLSRFLKNVIYALLYVIVIIAALNSLGVQTASLVAVLGAAGLAIGLSLKDQVANFGAGVLIIMLRPFKVGDLVSTGGLLGVVEDIQIFQTIMKTYDNLTVMVPNSKIMGGDITNYTMKGTRMIPLVMGISYSDDIKTAKNVLLEIMNAHEKIFKDPAPSAGVLELADSSVNIYARSWVNNADWWEVKTELLESMKYGLEAAGITIPFPQMDVHVAKEEKEA
jgi:small conductance mechanosensitive channel